TTGADNTSTTFSGTISGTGNLVKTGSGVFTFAGTGTYAGSTTVNQGTLRLSAAQPTGAVAHYTFAGNINDTTVNGHNGSFQGAGASFVPGQFGQALMFTGSQSVSVPFSPAFGLNSFTVSAWVNMSAGFTAFFNGIVGTRFGGDTTFDYKVQ